MNNYYLDDPRLFGDESGEREDQSYLAEFFLEKSEFRRAYDPRRVFQIIIGKKGTGKSALLSYSNHMVKNREPNSISVYIKPHEFLTSSDFSAQDLTSAIHFWMEVVCTRINNELSSKIKFAASDTESRIIKRGEIDGFKERNIVGALLDRIKVVGVDYVENEVASQINAFKKLAEKRDIKVWLFVDDIDAQFETKHQLKVSSFFLACSELCRMVRDLNIRVSVRPDVWTIIRRYNESLDRFDSEIINLYWRVEEIRAIIQRKVYTYFKRYDPARINERWTLENNARDITRLVFSDGYRWGKRWVLSDYPVSIYSHERPRWGCKLCSLAALNAYNNGRGIIEPKDINYYLGKYSRERLQDIYSEHNNQFNDLKNLLEIFTSGNRRYSTLELVGLVNDRYISRYGKPQLDGYADTADSLALSRYLFQIGFVRATGLANKRFLSFADRPDLLTQSTNIDSDIFWEIPGCFRSALNIR